MKRNKNDDVFKEFKDFIDVASGKKEVDIIKTLFSDDDKTHYKRTKEHNHSDEFDAAEDFAEEYEDDYDDEDEAMDDYDDEREDY